MRTPVTAIDVHPTTPGNTRRAYAKVYHYHDANHFSWTVHAVRNLGWLRANARAVLSLEIAPGGNEWECRLKAYLTPTSRAPGGRVFCCYFASRAVCERWITRPIFRGVPVTRPNETEKGDDG